MAAEHTPVSSYGAVSARMQTTQTLPVHTQPPSQSMPHEAPQFTQLVDHDPVEHVHGDTMLNSSSELEGPGNTLVLHDDVSPVTSRGGSSPLVNAQSASPLLVGVSRDNVLPLGVAAEDYGAINPPGITPSKKCIAPNVLDSDATTEEGDVDNVGYLDDAEAEADAESRHIDVHNGGNGAPDNLAVQRTPDDALVDDITDAKSSELRPISSASTQTSPLCAPLLLAVNENTSLDSARKDDVNFDSSATIELTPGKVKEPVGASEAELGIPEVPSADKNADFGSTQSLPKVVLPPSDPTTHSPCMLTSTCVSPGGASLQHASEQSPGNQVSLEFMKKFHQDGIVNDASPSTSTKKPPSTQDAKEFGSDNAEASVATLTGKLDDGGNAVLKALETENASGEFISVVHAPIRGQQLSLPSGFHLAPSNLSYLVSQEPGEETQLNAFNMVDKLAWLDTKCMPDDIVTSPPTQDGFVKDNAGAKGLRSRAQAAQMKSVRDKLDVFDWEDSQVDQVYTPPTVKQVPANIRSRKRQSEAYKPMTARKKQATFDQKGIETTLPMESKGNYSTSAVREKTTPDMAKTQVANLELSSSSLETKPHILLTTRLRNRTIVESRPLAKGRKASSSKRGPSKGAGKGKRIDESREDFKAEQQKSSENITAKVQLAGPSVKTEPRKSARRNKVVTEPDKDLKIEQPNGSDSKGKKFLQAASLSTKGKEEVLKTSKFGPNSRASNQLAERTSQDDAAADIWIEAFANTKNKTPTGGEVELIKFQKRTALHDDTGQDSKKSRTMEPSTVDSFEKDETPLKEKRVEPENSQGAIRRPENINAAKISRHRGRRVSTRLSQDENQEATKRVDNSVKEQQLIIKSKKPRTADVQVKAGRVSTRSSGQKHQDAPKTEDVSMKEDKIEQGPKTRQDPKQCETADAVIITPFKSKGVSACSSEQEPLNIIEEAGNTTNDSKLERGPKTRSKAQDVKSIVAGSDAEEGNRVANADIKSGTAQGTTNDKGGQSLSKGERQGDFKMVKPSTKTRGSKRKGKLFSHQHSTAEFNQDAQEIEADRCQAGLPPIDVNEGVPSGGPKRRSKRREANSGVPVSAQVGVDTDESVPKIQMGVPVSAQVGVHTDESVPKIDELASSKKGDVSKSTRLRRTRSNTYESESQKHEFVDIKKDGGQPRGKSAIEQQTLPNHTDTSDASKGFIKQVAKLDTKTTKLVPQRNKRTSTSEVLGKPKSSDGGKRRKRKLGSIRVLFSHSLTEDTIKHQKKILAKLGGQLATSASDCTHFVSNGFVRTQNMLISMAAGKIVVTPLWLENCGQAHFFVDAKKYLLQDEKKEKELGFSMTASLASAEQKPLLKGVRVLIGPNTAPEPAVLQAIVESAGGQVMDIKLCSSILDTKESDTHTIIIANEKDFEFCVQFLGKGLKVYSEELLLHGIVTQNLDFSRHRLFEDFKQRQGRRRSTNIGA